MRLLHQYAGWNWASNLSGGDVEHGTTEQVINSVIERNYSQFLNSP